VQTAAYSSGSATFSAERLRIARGIAPLASTALANARLLSELERVNRLKSEFVSTMSHELRTPLNVILGFIEMVRDPVVPDDDRREMYDRIEMAGRELMELIEATLTVGKMEAGRDEACFELVALPSLWEELRQTCSKGPSGQVALEWAQDVPAISLRTDPGKLKVIVRNLVRNALKFTERGAVRVEIEVDGESCSIRVADTGIGIRAEDKATIFDMFRQADGSDRRRYGGTGLGLYIVRRFVTQLGGTIDLESVPARGSLFTVRLPRTSPSRE
jgi:signal transduction histidine kinase